MKLPVAIASISLLAAAALAVNSSSPGAGWIEEKFKELDKNRDGVLSGRVKGAASH